MIYKLNVLVLLNIKLNWNDKIISKIRNIIVKGANNPCRIFWLTYLEGHGGGRYKQEWASWIGRILGVKVSTQYGVHNLTLKQLILITTSFSLIRKWEPMIRHQKISTSLTLIQITYLISTNLQTSKFSLSSTMETWSMVSRSLTPTMIRG